MFQDINNIVFNVPLNLIIVVEWKDKTQMHLSVNHVFLSNMYKVMSRFSRPSGVIHNDNERHVTYG